MEKTILTLGDFRRATADLPDEAVLNVGSAGSSLTWSVSWITWSTSCLRRADAPD